MDPAADTVLPPGLNARTGGRAPDVRPRGAVWRRLVPSIVLAAAVAAGMAVRVALWWQDRSFWRDELGLVQSLDAYSTRQLLGPLADTQSAPPLWLLLVRTVSLVAGDGERAYRLVPLACGCATVAVVALLAVSMVRRPWAALVPLLLLATLPELVFYTAQAKPYTMDTLTVTWLLLLSVRLLRGGGRRVELTWYASLVVLPWLSYGFMLAAPFVAGWVALVRLRRRTLTVGALALRLAVPAASVAASALLAHELTTRTAEFSSYWAGYLGPVGQTGSWWAWTGFVFEDLARHELGFPIWWAASVLVVAGLVVAVRRHPATGVLLVLPLAAAYGAGLLGLYPFGRRLALFCLPGLLVGLGVLVDRVTGWFVARIDGKAAGAPDVRRRRAGIALVVAVGVAASALVLDVAWTRPATLSNALRYLYGVDDYRGALAVVARRWRGGDVLVVGNGDRTAVRVYGPRLHIDPALAYQALPAPDRTPRRDCPLPVELSSAARIWLLTDDVVPVYPGPSSRSAIVAPLRSRFGSVWHRDAGLVTLQLVVPRGMPAPDRPAARCLEYAPVGKAGDPAVPSRLPAS